VERPLRTRRTASRRLVPRCGGPATGRLQGVVQDDPGTPGSQHRLQSGSDRERSDADKIHEAGSQLAGPSLPISTPIDGFTTHLSLTRDSTGTGHEGVGRTAPRTLPPGGCLRSSTICHTVVRTQKAGLVLGTGEEFHRSLSTPIDGFRPGSSQSWCDAVGREWEAKTLRSAGSKTPPFHRRHTRDITAT
jgi:hypothetical protein